MNFYKFNQNNSGGGFTVDDKLCHYLFIEAQTNLEANHIAEKLGVYFYGCEDGIDCSCCGDRWDRASDYDIVDLPKNIGNNTYHTIEEYAQWLADNYGWTEPDCRIYYNDGRIVEIFSKP